MNCRFSVTSTLLLSCSLLPIVLASFQAKLGIKCHFKPFGPLSFSITQMEPYDHKNVKIISSGSKMFSQGLLIFLTKKERSKLLTLASFHHYSRYVRNFLLLFFFFFSALVFPDQDRRPYVSFFCCITYSHLGLIINKKN